MYLNITLKMDLDLSKMNTVDPLKRHVEKSLDTEEHTPFDPPEAYAPATVKGIAFEDMHPAIQLLMREHRDVMKITSEFETALIAYKAEGYKLTKEINGVFGKFYEFFDKNLLLHNAKEDKGFFPKLQLRLLESGEHSVGENPRTAIDIMEDDHLRFVQLGSLSFNLFGLAARITDPASRITILDAAYDAARELIELLKLHIHREDYTLFPLAMKLMSPEELEQSEKEMKKIV